MTSLDAVALGERIATARKAKKLRQTDLSRESFVSLPMVKAIEQGKRYPSDTTLEAIAAALGVDPTRLLDTHTGTETRVHAALPAISASLAAYDVALASPRRTLDELHATVADTVNWRLAAQYGRIAQHTPELLDDVLAAPRTGHRRAAVRRPAVPPPRPAPRRRRADRGARNTAGRPTSPLGASTARSAPLGVSGIGRPGAASVPNYAGVDGLPLTSDLHHA